jgi:hypothetical protein
MTSNFSTTQTTLIDEESWGASRYLSDKFQVFISLAGFPDTKGDTQLSYCLTLADLNFNEISTREFANLTDDTIYAIENKRFGALQQRLSIFRELAAELAAGNKYGYFNNLSLGYNPIFWLKKYIHDLFEYASSIQLYMVMKDLIELL